MRPGVLPLAIVAGIALAAILGPLLLPWSYDAIDWSAVRAPPLSPGHLLGTDAVGRDLLARTLAGTRVTLAVAGAAAGVALAIGTLWGMIAGWCGGRIDEAIAAFTAAIAVDPRDSAPLTDRGITRFLAGDLTAAEADLRHSLGLNPADSYAATVEDVWQELRDVPNQ